jgi:uncharacterized repeat protein (TIGR03803 family)
VTTTFTLSDTSSAYGVGTYDPPLTLATFSGANGANPTGDLISDAAGYLFGTTFSGGADEDGTVFEIAKSTGELTTLATFTGANGRLPFGTVISDAAGDLFGTTEVGGGANEGTVFEIVKSTGALITLATFTGANGANPAGSLTIDAEGNLFGTTEEGGADDDGTVFEIAKSTGLLTTLATFTGANGEDPERSLTIDAAGDMFGTTYYGGADNDGTVFEIVKSTGALITLATFTGANGANPLSDLVSDAAGDLFGTTEVGGADNDGTAFEIAKSTGLLMTLATFTGANGEEPDGGLTINSAGDLFGTTYYGGANNDGTVFELPATFVATPTVDDTTTVTVTVTVTDSDPVVAPTMDISLHNTSGQLALWQVNGATTPTLSAAALLGADPGSSWLEVGTGSFFSGGATDASDILLQNTNGSVAVWQMQGATLLSADVVANPGPSWQVDGVGDFNGDGKSDIVLQNTNGSVGVWEMSGGQISQAGVVANPGPSWQVEATGDFNGDGKSDIVVQNTDGTVGIWNMNGDQISQASVVANPGPSWKVVGTGDFNGNGHTDLLLQNTDGSVAIWEMNGDQLSQGIEVANPGASWHVANTGDFNQDGMTDIVLQNNNGAVAVWDMDGGQILHASDLANPGPTWSVVGGHIG